MNNYKQIANFFIYSFFGVTLTIFFAFIGCTAVVASSVTGIILSLVAITVNDEHRSSWAGFAGSFAGMISLSYLTINNNSIISYIIPTIILALLFAALYTASEIVSLKYPGMFFDGYGGRLGTIAFLSVIIFIIFKYICKPFPVMIFHKPALHFFHNPFFFLCIGCSFTAALLTMEIKNAMSSLNENYKVLSVAISGLLGGILLVYIPQLGDEYAAAWYTGAFVGMSSYFILMLKRSYFISGLLAGILFVIFRPFMVGFGGKLGFISFLAVLIMKGSGKLYGSILIKLSQKKLANIEGFGAGADIAVNDDYAQQLVASLMAGTYTPEEQDFAEEDSGEIDMSKNYHEEERLELRQLLEMDEQLLWCCIESHTPSLYTVTSGPHELIGATPDESFHKLANVLLRERRPLIYSHQMLNKVFFLTLFSPAELSSSHYAIIAPVICDDQLRAIYVILLRHEDMDDAKNQAKFIKQACEELFNN